MGHIEDLHLPDDPAHIRQDADTVISSIHHAETCAVLQVNDVRQGVMADVEHLQTGQHMQRFVQLRQSAITQREMGDEGPLVGGLDTRRVAT